VTKPTTINAITDMPAKIPRPIGSTEIFFPGIWKADAALEDGEAEVLSASADVPLLPAPPLEDLVDCEGGGEVVVVTERATVDSPTTDTPGSGGAVDAGGGEEVEEGGATDDEDVEATALVDAGGVCVSLDWTPGTIVHCRTTCTRDSPFGPVTGVKVTMHV
jgi:hypothetical protein